MLDFVIWLLKTIFKIVYRNRDIFCIPIWEIYIRKVTSPQPDFVIYFPDRIYYLLANKSWGIYNIYRNEDTESEVKYIVTYFVNRAAMSTYSLFSPGISILYLFAVAVIGQALTPSTYFTTVDQQRLRTVFETSQPYADVTSAHYSILGLKLLNIEIPKPKVNVDISAVAIILSG